MASAKKLPEFDVLLQHVQDGLSNLEIGRLYGVTGEAVRQALEKGGFRRADARSSHAHYLPWRIRADHAGDVLARRLRAYSKRQQGKPLSDTEERLLDAWIRYMEGSNPTGLPLSVHYNRTDDEGFWLEPRASGDRDFISPPAEAA